MHALLRSAAAIVLALAAACGAPEQDAARTESAPPAARAAEASAGDVSSTQVAAAPALAGDSVTVTVYKSPTCGCCEGWVDHMREAGFKVVAFDTNDLNAIKHQHGVAQDLGSCHTSLVNGYVLEGHVPAEDVKRLLAERPRVAGLAVPGMPMGSPGMEGPISQRYDVVAFDRNGGRSIFARH